MTATLTTLAAAIKVMYPQRVIEEALFEDCPLWAVMPKSTEWVGTPMHIALAISGVPGSATFSTAQTNSGAVTNVGFDVTHVRDYAIVRASTESQRFSRDKEGALIQAVKQQTNGALYTIKKHLGIKLYRSGSGSLGRIGSGADSATLTLTDARDAYNFEIGDVLVSNSVDSASGISTNTGTIVGIDYVAGTLTASAAWHADFDTNDYLFRQGDADACMSGLAAWNPATAPSATTFFGRDRTTSSKLYGVIYDYTVAADGTMERYLQNALGRCCPLGGNPKTVVIHPQRWANFQNELGDKVRYDRMPAKYSDGGEASMGFDTIVVTGPKGKVNVMADPFCPYNTVRGLDMNHWKFYTAGNIGWIDEDGKGQWLRQDNADGIEARLGWFGQLTSDFPGASFVGSLAALNA